MQHRKGRGVFLNLLDDLSSLLAPIRLFRSRLPADLSGPVLGCTSEPHPLRNSNRF